MRRSTKYTKQECTSIHIEELKAFVQSGRKADVYEPNPKYWKIDGYLKTPQRTQEALKYAASCEDLPVLVHCFKGIVVIIRTDI